MAHPAYQKTAAKWQGMLTGASLWLADDHILSVRNMRFSEEYKRYYYHEIQALQLRPAPRLWCPSWLAVLLIVLAVCVPIFSVSLKAGAVVCGACFAALAGYAAYRSLVSCCVCHVVTAVSTDEVPALKTITTSRKVIALIAQRAAQAQGELAENWLEMLDENLSKPPADRNVAKFLVSVDSRRDRPGVAAALAALTGTLFDGVITLAQVNRWHVPEWLGMANALLAVAAAVSMVMLLRSHRYLWLRNISLAAVLFLGLLTYTSYMVGNFRRAVPSTGLALAGNLLSYVNIAGDFCLVIAALVLLWLRWRASRLPAQTDLAGAAAVGEA